MIAPANLFAQYIWKTRCIPSTTVPSLAWGGLEPETAFGIVLRKLRKARGLSQETLAFEADVERNYISLLELGRNSVSIKVVFRLACALNVSVVDFMGMVEAKVQEARNPTILGRN